MATVLPSPYAKQGPRADVTRTSGPVYLLIGDSSEVAGTGILNDKCSLALTSEYEQENTLTAFVSAKDVWSHLLRGVCLRISAKAERPSHRLRQIGLRPQGGALNGPVLSKSAAGVKSSLQCPPREAKEVYLGVGYVVWLAQLRLSGSRPVGWLQRRKRHY